MSSEQKRIIVTGGSGLLGRGVHWAVNEGGMGSDNEEWIFLTSKDGNLVDEGSVKAIFDKHKPTHVIHLAAMVGGLFHNMRIPADLFHGNILMNTHVLHYAHLYNCKRVISCWSTCEMPDGIPIPISEDDLHVGPPHFSNFANAHAKRMIDIQNRAYHQQYGRCFTGIIPVNVFGPEGNYSLENGHVIPGLIHKSFLAKKNNTPLPVWGTGKPLRQFVYSRDIGRLLVWMIRSYDSVQPLIAFDENCEISINQVVDCIVNCMEFNGEIVYDISKADGRYRKTCSNARLRSFLPDFKFTNFQTAIKECCDWFNSNYDNARK